MGNVFSLIMWRPFTLLMLTIAVAVTADFMQMQAEFNKHIRAKQDNRVHQMRALQQELWGGDYLQFLEEEVQAVSLEHTLPNPVGNAKQRPPAPVHTDDLNAEAYDWMV